MAFLIFCGVVIAIVVGFFAWVYVVDNRRLPPTAPTTRRGVNWWI
jgi:hypothetical protein